MPTLPSLTGLRAFLREAGPRERKSAEERRGRGRRRGIPVPALSSALEWLDGLRTENLPANLLQAQRDYFGAHTYERVDRPRGQFFHTNWTGHGGSTSASAYVV